MTIRFIPALLLFIPLAACSSGLFGQKEALQAEEDARRGAIIQIERKADQQRARMDILEGEMGLLRRDVGQIRSDIINLVQQLESLEILPQYKKRTLPVPVAPDEDGQEVEEKNQEDHQEKAGAATDASDAPPRQDIRPADIQYGLHLASYRNLDKLSDGWDELRAKYPALLASLVVRISVLDIRSFGGIYYRLKAGPLPDKIAADNLCLQFQAAGEYCVVAEFTGDPLN